MKRLLIVGLILLSLTLLLVSFIGFPKPDRKILGVNTPQEVPKENYGFPVRLKIPSIDVDAKIQQVGVNPIGEMEVPSNTVDVGWFKFGARPGEKGNAVISGHFNGEKGGQGVFANLHQLKEGDKLYIVDNNDLSITFIVRESRSYDPGYAEEVFSPNYNYHLNLVTCDGEWDETKKSYSKRLVVFTDISY